MKAKFRKAVHPKYKGIAKWQVEQVASLPQLIEYSDPVQGKVSYDARILLLESPECENKVLWFNYWIAPSKTSGRMRCGTGHLCLKRVFFWSYLRMPLSKVSLLRIS